MKKSDTTHLGNDKVTPHYRVQTLKGCDGGFAMMRHSGDKIDHFATVYDGVRARKAMRQINQDLIDVVGQVQQACAKLVENALGHKYLDVNYAYALNQGAKAIREADPASLST